MRRRRVRLVEAHAPLVVVGTLGTVVDTVVGTPFVVPGPRQPSASRGGFRDEAVVHLGVRVLEMSRAVDALSLGGQRGVGVATMRRGLTRGVFALEEREGLTALGR